jgi:hypothetical protein
MQPNGLKERSAEKMANDSFFVRVIISLTTFLAIIALLFRNWLYTFWIDYKSSKQFYFRLMELQKNAKATEISIHDGDPNTDEKLSS